MKALSKSFTRGKDLVSKQLDKFTKKGNLKDHAYLYSIDEVVEAYRKYAIADMKDRGVNDGAIDLMLKWRMEDFENDLGALYSIFRRFLTQH